MYEIEFYEDENGYSETAEFIQILNRQTSKNARINLTKIVAYFNELEKYGTRIGQPVTKHLKGEIWELRPLRNRILYAYVKDNKFIMLCVFLKKTRKTPKHEIEKANKYLSDYIERNEK